MPGMDTGPYSTAPNITNLRTLVPSDPHIFPSVNARETRRTSMTSRLLIAAACLPFVIVVGCQCSSDIDPDAPPQVPPPAHVRPVVRSTVFIPVEIPISEVAALVNDAVPYGLYSVTDERVRGGIFPVKMDLDITRNGEIKTKTKAGTIRNDIPIRASGRVRLPPGIWRPFQSTFTIRAETELTLREDWTTVAKTKGDFTWVESPSITIFGIRIGLEGKAESALQAELTRLAPQIDALIEEKVNLRTEADKIWDSIGEPIEIRSNPPAWLLIRPVGTYFTEAVSESDTFVVGLNVEAELETVLGDRPTHVLRDSLPPLVPLPDSLSRMGQQGFEMHLPVTITYDEARNLLGQSLGGRLLNVQENVTVRVDSVDLYASGPTVIARMDFQANIGESQVGTSGRLYLQGVPAYDSLSQTISLDSLDYDLNSRNALAKAADWIFHGTFLEQTRDQLRFPIGDDVVRVSDQITAALSNRALGKHIVLDGVIAEFTPADIYLTEDGINVEVFVRGVMVARVRGLGELRIEN